MPRDVVEQLSVKQDNVCVEIREHIQSAPSAPRTAPNRGQFKDIVREAGEIDIGANVTRLARGLIAPTHVNMTVLSAELLKPNVRKLNTEDFGVYVIKDAKDSVGQDVGVL